VHCWGNNDEGQLGSGTRAPAPGPVRVRRITAARSVAAGVAHTCAALADGTVACWGNDGYGQRGGTTFGLRTAEPVRVAGIVSATSVTAGRNHTCALLAGGAVVCWGSNLQGQLGNRTGAVSPSVPVVVEGIADGQAVAAGFFHTCVLLRDRSVRCWGANGAGQLGAPSRSQTVSLLPLPVSGDPRASTIAAGGFYTCALLLDGAVACWGANDFRQLGYDATADVGDAVEARADGRDALRAGSTPTPSPLPYRKRR
jgi:alpha-tubulin suppressor-like RCC1 family protein